MIVKKLQIPAHIPGIVSKRLFDLSCPLYAYWVTIEEYRLGNAGTRYWTIIFLVSICIVFLKFWGSCVFRIFILTAPKFSEDAEQKKYEKYGRNKGVEIPDVSTSNKNRYCNKYPQGSLFVPCVRHPNTEKKQPGDADDVKDEFKHRIHSLLFCFRKYGVVASDVILCAPIRKIAARVRENVSLFHRPARPTGFPIVPGEGFVLVRNGTIDVFPDLINPVQVMPAFNQVPFRVTSQTLKHFISRAREKRFVRLIYGHHEIPFSDRFCAVVTLPKRYRVTPVQIVRFLSINLCVCGSPKNQKESGNE